MSGVLKTTVSTYEFDLDAMKALIAADLNVAQSTINVEYVIQEVGGDPMDRFPGHKQVTKVKVTVNHDRKPVGNDWASR